MNRGLYYPVVYGLSYAIKRIPIDQPGLHGKQDTPPFFLSWAHVAVSFLTSQWEVPCPKNTANMKKTKPGYIASC